VKRVASVADRGMVARDNSFRTKKVEEKDGCLISIGLHSRISGDFFGFDDP